MNAIKYDGNRIVAWSECDWRPKETIDQKRALKLSAAIRLGAQSTGATKDLGPGVESWKTYKDGRCFTCVIGAAWIGAGKDINRLYGDTDSIGGEWMAKAFGVPRDVCADAHVRYEFQNQSREEIAAWLEGQGY